jgi:hypothetical protein
MEIKMKNSHKFLAGIALVALCLISVQNTATAQAISEKVPWNSAAFVPCANGGAGEVVIMTGTLHVVTNIVVDGNGCTHIVQQVNPMKASGVGQTTGDKYQVTGMGHATRKDYTTCEETCEVFTKHVDNYRVIGPGKGNNFTVHQFHEEKFNICTEEFTLISSKLKIECK